MASSPMRTVISQTDFPKLKLRGRGKVRDIYDLGRPLADCGDGPAFRFRRSASHSDSGQRPRADAAFPILVRETGRRGPAPRDRSEGFRGRACAYAASLEGRAMLVRRTDPVPIECVVRGYISGSGWKDYQKSGAICGIPLPAGLRESDRLPEPIFTPSTKATTGHDENISFDETASRIGHALAERLRKMSLTLYRRAAEHAAARGIIIADTKFEFGLLGQELIWIDEALTPDSSRFWPADHYAPGKSQPSFDKQYVRDYLEQIGWNKQPPAPALPQDVVAGTRERYREAYQRITGHALD